MNKVLYALEMPHGSSYVGGIANIINQYVKNSSLFEDNGFTVEVFDETKENTRSRFIPKKIRNIVNALKQKNALIKYVSNENDIIIHIHTAIGWTLLKDLYIIKYLRKATDSKIVVSIHFAELDKILYSKKYIRKYELKILKNCVDEIIFLSEETKKEFIAQGIDESKTDVLYTFHDFDMSRKEVDNNSYSDSLKLLFVGSIDKRKGILDLLDVMEELSDTNVILNICGQVNDKSIKDDYEMKVATIGEKVIEHGYVKGSRKEEIFIASDVLILPSYGEGMPIVIMEAMASWNAIISTKVGSIPEIIQPENGILIKPGDKAALKDAIMFYLSDFDRVRRTKIENHRKGMEFGLHGNVNHLCSIYKKL